MLLFILIDVHYSEKAVFSFEKGSNYQNQFSSGSLYLVKKIPPSKISDSPPTPGVQLPRGYTEPLWGESLLFTRNSWYSLNQPWKDERLRWPWSRPMVLNLCINLVITKYKLKPQYVKLTQLWSLTVNCFKVSSQSYLAGLSKICFLCTYVDQMIIQ